MRDTATSASSYQRQQLPASLIQRLETMQHLAQLVEAQAGRQRSNALAVRRAPPRRAQVIVLAWFSLGVMTSGAAGVGALLGLRALETGGEPPVTAATLGQVVDGAWAAAWRKASAMAAAAMPAKRTEGRWDRVQVAIDRSARAHAPLGLQVTGGGSDAVYFVLDGVPEGVRPSHGALVGPATWVLGRADLDGLHLALDAAAPEAFDLKIAVLAPSGVAKSGSVVQVRLVDSPAPTRIAAGRSGDSGNRTAGAAAQMPTAAPPARAATAAGTPPARRPEGGSLQPRALTPAAPQAQYAQQTRHAQPIQAAQQTQAAGARAWPEGAYGLGAVPRAQPKQPGWWNAPQPDWSPFENETQQP